MCEHTYWNEPPQDMSFEKIKSIVDQFPVLRWIAFTGIGEIFLNKDLLKTYRYLTKKWPGIHIELFDNFYFIDEEKAKELLDLGLGTIFISFNAATKETYEKVMVGSDFSRVVVNIKRFIELKKERRAYFPEVIFHNQINYLTVHVSPNLSRQVQEKAKKAGIYITWNADTCVNKTPLSHCNAWITPFVYVSGDVVPCCAMNEGNIRDFQKLNSLGNVFQQSFKEIWYGKKFSDLRNQMQVGMIPLLCRDCPMFDLAAIK
jgi:MoaA/NifB/PqqE/SkfB family radical SAM enzyme